MKKYILTIALFLLGLLGVQNQIYAQSPILEIPPSPTPIAFIPTPSFSITITGTPIAAPTSAITTTGTPIAAPTSEIIPISSYIPPATPIPTLMLYLSPTSTTTPPSPIHANPTLIPTITPTLTPAKYWLSLGLNGIPADEINTAEKLLDYLSSFGTEAYEIDRWYGGWEPHIHNLPFNDFPINIGEGYEIAFKGNPGINNFLIPYKEIYSSSLTYNLGYWKLISIPSELLKSISSLPTAEDLCRSTINQGATTVEIDYHDLTPVPYSWSAHFCRNNENNFPIFQGHGYFIRTNSYSTWTLNPVTPTPTPTIIPTDTPTPTVTITPTFSPTPTDIPTPTSTVIPTNSPSPTSTPVPTNTPTITPIITLPTITLAPQPQKEKPTVIINPSVINKDLCFILKIKNAKPAYPIVNFDEIMRCINSSVKNHYNPFIFVKY